MKKTTNSSIKCKSNIFNQINPSYFQSCCFNIFQSVIIILTLFVLISPVVGSEKLEMANQSSFSDIRTASSSIASDLQQEIHKKIGDDIANESAINERILIRENNIRNLFLISDSRSSIKAQPYGFTMDEGILRKEVGNSTTKYTNEVPKGGYILHASDGITRVFSSNGTEEFFVNDNEADEIIVPSCGTLKTTHSISVPSGSVINRVGHNVHVEYQDEIFVTIVNGIEDATRDDLSKFQLDSSDIIPSTSGGQWVEWAKNTSPYSVGSFSTDWTIPHSPNLTRYKRN